MADLNGIPLPDDVQWLDEDKHTPISHNKKYTAGGRLQITRGRKQKGRLLTLYCHTQDITKTVLEQLQALRDADETMVLTLADNRQFTVMFDHENGHIEAVPLFDYAVTSPDDLYEVTLHLFEI